MLLSLTQTAFLSIFKLCQVGLDDSPADLAGDDDQLLLAPALPRSCCDLHSYSTCDGLHVWWESLHLAGELCLDVVGSPDPDGQDEDDGWDGAQLDTQPQTAGR